MPTSFQMRFYALFLQALKIVWIVDADRIPSVSARALLLPCQIFCLPPVTVHQSAIWFAQFVQTWTPQVACFPHIFRRRHPLSQSFQFSSPFASAQLPWPLRPSANCQVLWQATLESEAKTMEDRSSASKTAANPSLASTSSSTPTNSRPLYSSKLAADRSKPQEGTAAPPSARWDSVPDPKHPAFWANSKPFQFSASFHDNCCCYLSSHPMLRATATRQPSTRSIRAHQHAGHSSSPTLLPFSFPSKLALPSWSMLRPPPPP